MFCWFWQHNFQEVQKELLGISYPTFFPEDLHQITRITYQCSKCHSFKQVDLKGNVMDNDKKKQASGDGT